MLNEVTVQRIRWIRWGTHPITDGSNPDIYLKSRGICLESYPDDLRQDTEGNMLALIRDATYGMPVSYQRTFLPEKIRKMAAGCSIPPGSAVRLFPAARIMGVAEGVETALSASLLYGMPVWATLSAGCMKRFVAPRCVEHLYIFADNDANRVGWNAAQRLSLNSMRSFIIPHVKMAPRGDWNDFLVESV